MALLRHDLYRIQDAMTTTEKSGDELRMLAAKGEVISQYLERALRKPKKE